MSIIPTNNQLSKLSRNVSNVEDIKRPALLLCLRDIIDDKNNDKESLLKEIWKLKFPEMITAALKQDFRLVPGTWLTACQLCNIAIDCCHHSVDLQRLKKEYIPSLTYLILNICKEMMKEYHAVEEIFKVNVSGNLSHIIALLSNLMEKFVFVSVTVVSSKHFMHLLMSEDTRLSLLSLALLKTIMHNNCDIFFYASESRMHSVADELAFKISSTKDVKVAMQSISILLNLIRMYSTLLELFVTKRYRGFKTYLLKWKKNGFDGDINDIIKLIDKKAKEMQASRVYDNAATVIQSFYRGYSTRRRLKMASSSVAKLQRAYRERVRTTHEQAEVQQMEKMRRDVIDKKRREYFLASKTKQLKVIESIPAGTVNKFLDKLQQEAASKIQAAWVGWKTRRNVHRTVPSMRQDKAATVIQHQIRRWFKFRCQQKKEARLCMLPDGLTDTRRVELQNVITNIREKFPKHDVTDDDMLLTHEKAFRILNNHVIGLRSMRRRDNHRKALIGQLTIQSDQFSKMPSLETINSDVIFDFTSRSTAIMVAAKKRHLECMTEFRKPWWKNLDTEKTIIAVDKSDNLPPALFGSSLQELFLVEKNF